MNARPIRNGVAAALVLLAVAVPAPVDAQARQITEDFIELLLRAFAAEQAELDRVSEQLAAVDEKIRNFEECKAVIEAAGDAGGRMGGLAARAAIRARCGASDADGFRRDRQRILEGPEKAALDILRLRSADYNQLKARLTGFYQTGSGFTEAEAALLNARRGDFAAALRIDLAAYAGGGGSVRDSGGRGPRGMRSAWTTDYAWEYIGHMFEVMYISGATVFEKPYQPGQWTRWDIVSRDTRYTDDNRPAAELEQKRSIERAFLGVTDEGGEWWRTTSIDFYEENGVMKADTVTLESLFKPINEYARQLVRVRAKLPGQEANEMMVPQHFAMLSLLSVFPMRPTDESVRGATIGNERVGNFDARHVRFAAGGGNIEWWLADDAPGGWVRFRHTEQPDADVREPGTYTIQMTASGTGARSLLGVM